MIEPPAWIAVGRITRAHGVKGEVSVLRLSEVESRFAAGSRLFLDEDAGRSLTVASARPHRDRILVLFEEVADRTGAEALRGAYLFVPSSSAPPLPDGEFWAHQLVGCEVVTESGRPLGLIREVIHTPANDVWVAVDEGGESMVPALKDVVVNVDVEARRVTVRDVPGLTAP